MTSSQEPKDDFTEVCLPSPHGDYLITVGYNYEYEAYYVMVHNKTLREWNDEIYAHLDALEMDDPFDMVRVNSLEAALADALLDKRYPLKIDEVIVILGLIANADSLDIDNIINMQQRKH